MNDELRLVGYATGNFGKNLVWSAADVTLIFILTDLLGITPASAGALMLVAVGGDLVFDLLVGASINRATSLGFGYRTFIIAGAAPCAIAFATLYALPWLGGRQFWTLALTLLVFRGSYAVIDVPHNALLASVAPESHARGRASGYRLFFSSVASLAVATILLPNVVSSAAHKQSASLAVLGLVAGLLFALALLSAAAVSGTNTAIANRSEAGPRISKEIIPRMDALIAALAVIAFITGFAMPMFGRMLLYLSTYVLGRPDFASQALAAITVGQFGGVLLWTWLVRYRDKTTLLAAGYILTITGILLFALTPQYATLMLASAALAGVGLSVRDILGHHQVERRSLDRPRRQCVGDARLCAWLNSDAVSSARYHCFGVRGANRRSGRRRLSADAYADRPSQARLGSSTAG